MNKFIPPFFLTCLFVCHTIIGFGQTTAKSHQLYLLSNLESLSPQAPELKAIEDLMKKEQNDFTVLINGDFIDKNGLGSKPEQKDLDKIDRLIELAGEKGKIIFIPGDREWNNGKKKGLKKVKALQKYLKSKKLKEKILYPRSGCLGPAIIDIGDHLRIAAINTQWFVEDEIGPEEEDADCGLLNETAFWAEMEDVLGDSENRNLVIAGHHPVLSFGQYAGYKLTKQHFSPPIIGSFIASYHQNVGGPKDLMQINLRRYTSNLLRFTQRFPGSIMVSGHEYDTQLLYKNFTYHINSGATSKGQPVGRGRATIYKSKKPGFVKLSFAEDGKVSMEVLKISNRETISSAFEIDLFASPCGAYNSKVPANINYNPCLEDLANHSNQTEEKKSGTAIAGAEYSAGFLKQLILGKHYRSTWTKPVHNIPYLDLDTTDGGLTPYAKGGGAQTTSIKFRSGNGKTYAFRSINKTPTQRMDQDLRPGIYGRITQDKTSHQHPYSSTILGSLMDRLDIPHSMPKLYLMPDSPKLGVFRKEFGGMFGTLELKPKGKKKGRVAFEGADKVRSTFDMYRKMLDDHDHKVDTKKFVRARLFDIWISDWDRHVKNYKWLGYKEGKTTTYSPFPKDRDKALSVYQGFYWIIEVFHVQADKANFRKNYYGLKYLNYKNKSMDRWLANSFTKEDWMAEVKIFQELMTDEAIEEAIQSLPPETQEIARKKISPILKARRDKLPKAIERYYKLLAKYIDLVGSNSRELFELDRLKNGDVQADIYKMGKDGSKKKKLYSRLIKKSETDEIRLHGLGKKDHFIITGETNKSILIRIIGGKGKDIIEEKSKVKGARKMTRVYDKRGKDKLSLNTEAKKIETPLILTFESQNMFNYNYFKILPNFNFNTDDGFTIGFTGNYSRQGFNEPGFSQKYNFGASVTTRKNYNLNVDAQYRHVIKMLDLITGLSVASRDKSFRNFYGLGNESVLLDSLREINFYRNDASSIHAYLGLSHNFWNKSMVSISGALDTRNVVADPGDDTRASIYDNLNDEDGINTNILLGPRFNLNMDLRDNGNFPTKGMQLKVNNFTFFNASEDFESGGRLETELSSYFTVGIKAPITLALRSGYITSYGEAPFYYKSFLGQQGNHRGYRKNRFGGDSAGYINTDLRIHFGKTVTSLVPIKYGIFGLFDAGRTWSDGESSDEIHYAYGGGFYLIPYADSFNLTLTFAKNEQAENLFSFRIGFFVR